MEPLVSGEHCVKQSWKYIEDMVSVLEEFHWESQITRCKLKVSEK